MVQFENIAMAANIYQLYSAQIYDRQQELTRLQDHLLKMINLSIKIMIGMRRFRPFIFSALWLNM